MNNHYTYFIILGLSIAGPLALSFDKKVAFYKKWKYLFPAMLLPALFYIVWDVFFTYKGVWSFNENYITGIILINLPIEEVLFFFVVPYCCVFVYECIRCYFPQWQNKKLANSIFWVLGILLLVTGIIFHQKYYTGYTFILCGCFILFIKLIQHKLKSFDITSFLISYAIILIPFLIVNGFLTAIPVVLYNNAENLGLRIYTIPFEDTFYGMLLILMNVVIYERLVTRNK
ncbi:MAG: lycopene cyclase domain-containing protein [Ferruginibacter sp.]|nr:lycopene cyclase domain-containing protein [Ferruginibacter sp.]